MGTEGWKELQRACYAARVKSDRRRRWKELDDQLARPFPLQWLPLEWTEQEKEEEKDTVHTICANALEFMDQYL